MLIEGKKNLEFLKRAILSHEIYCAKKYLNADDNTRTETWDPEFAEITKMLDAVEFNLKQYKEDDSKPAFSRTNGEAVKTPES